MCMLNCNIIFLFVTIIESSEVQNADQNWSNHFVAEMVEKNSGTCVVFYNCFKNCMIGYE